MGAETPLALTISPDPIAINWFGRNGAAVEFVLTNADTRVCTCKLCVVRADLMPAGSIAGESDELVAAAGETIIADGWVEARLSGGAWAAIDDWDNGLDLGAIAAGATVGFEVRLTIPDVLEYQGKSNFALLIAANDVAIPLFYDDFESYNIDTIPTTFTVIDDGNVTAGQVVLSTEIQGVETNVFAVTGEIATPASVLSAIASCPEVAAIDFIVRAAIGNYPGMVGFGVLVEPSHVLYRIASIELNNGNFLASVSGSETIDPVIIGSYNTDDWYRITIVMNRADKLYSVYINKILVAEDIDTLPSASPSGIMIASGVSAVGINNRIAVDKIGLYDAEAYTLEQIWEN